MRLYVLVMLACGCGRIGFDDVKQFQITLRDFEADHPDMENVISIDRGIVTSLLDDDGKPAYALDGPSMTVTGPETFAQWYRDVPGINTRYLRAISLVPDDNILRFDDTEFFPLDDVGTLTGGHNFYFTTEVHASFTYLGGERFTFVGDDDLWVYVDGRLALDLGGVHGPEEGVVVFDDIAGSHGLVIGETYPLDIFHAERYTTMSTFRIETSISTFE